MLKNYLLVSFVLLSTVPMSAQQTNGLFLNDSLAFNGYTLFSAINYSHTYLIDNCGYLVNEWESSHKPGLSVYLLENGNLLKTNRISTGVFFGGGSGGGIEMRDWEGDLLWQYIYSEDFVHHQHHDIEYLPNGNILVIAWEYKTTEEAMAAGRNPVGLGLSFHPDKVVEIRPVGMDSIETVWEWHAFDHLIQDYDSTKANYGVVADHPELIDLNYTISASPDWMHSNSVDYNADLDQIILSVRNYSELWVIDHSTTTAEAAGHTGGNSGRGGDLLYRWGNPQTYDRGSSADRILYGQHDAQWIAEGLPDAGKIMVFNNGRGAMTDPHSSVSVIAPPVDATGNYTLNTGEAFAPNQPDWTYTASPAESFYSINISGAHRLPNGNTLICEGDDGRLFEVNMAGQVLWEYIIPVGTMGPLMQGANMSTNQNATFRAYRYAPDYPAFTGRDLTPDMPIEVSPLTSDCQIYEMLVATDETAPFNFINIHPNPVSSLLNIENNLNKGINIEIHDMRGRSIYQNNFSDYYFQINMNDYPEGVYMLKCYTNDGQLLTTKKLVVVHGE